MAQELFEFKIGNTTVQGETPSKAFSLLSDDEKIAFIQEKRAQKEMGAPVYIHLEDDDGTESKEEKNEASLEEMEELRALIGEHRQARKEVIEKLQAEKQEVEDLLESKLKEMADLIDKELENFEQKPSQEDTGTEEEIKNDSSMNPENDLKTRKSEALSKTPFPRLTSIVLLPIQFDTASPYDLLDNLRTTIDNIRNSYPDNGVSEQDLNALTDYYNAQNAILDTFHKEELELYNSKNNSEQDGVDETNQEQAVDVKDALEKISTAEPIALTELGFLMFQNDEKLASPFKKDMSLDKLKDTLKKMNMEVTNDGTSDNLEPEIEATDQEGNTYTFYKTFSTGFFGKTKYHVASIRGPFGDSKFSQWHDEEVANFLKQKPEDKVIALRSRYYENKARSTNQEFVTAVEEKVKGYL